MRRLRREIEAQPDMEIVGVRLNPMEVLLIAREEIDVVIIPLSDSEEPGLVSHLLAEYPNVTVLLLSPTGDSAFVIQLCPWRREFLNMSEANILEVLRRVTRDPCSPIDDLDR